MFHPDIMIIMLGKLPNPGLITPEIPSSWPELNVTFYFSGHNQIEEYAGIAPYFEDTQAFIFESGNISFIHYLQLLSGRPSKPGTTKLNFANVEEAVESTYINDTPVKKHPEEIMLRGLFNSGAVVCGFDQGVPKELKNAIGHGLDHWPLYENFDTTLQWLAKTLQQRSIYQTQRENLMIGRFVYMVDTILYALSVFFPKCRTIFCR